MKRSLSVLTVLFLVLLLITGVLWLRESGHVAFERVLVPSSAEKQNNFESSKEKMIPERKYCTTCQMDKPLEGGALKSSKIKRWVCKSCLARITVSKYASKPKKEK